MLFYLRYRLRFMPTKPHLFRHYGAGLTCIFAGAWLTEVTGSFLPLAMGASVALICTASVVRSILARRTQRSQAQER